MTQTALELTCPVCASRAPVEAFCANAAAAAALRAALELSATGRAVLRYLRLFTKKRPLHQDRVAALINELLPDIAAQRVIVGGVEYDAPAAAWVWAIESMLQRHAAGSLRTPLDSHAYLYKVLAGGGWRAQPADALTNVVQSDAPASRTSAARASLAALREPMQ